MDMRKTSIIRSMTGYGKGVCRTEECSAYVEIKGMNHKYLEINMKLPDEFLKMELEIRKLIKNNIKRGAVYLSLNFTYDAPLDLKIDSVLFQKLLNLEKEIEERHGISQPINIHFILNYPGVIKQIGPKIPFKIKRESIMEAVNEAISSFINTKELEGENLKKDIMLRISKMGRYIEILNILENKERKKIEEKLGKRAEEITPSTDISGEQMPAIGSVNEEIVRFSSHIKMIKQTFRKGGEIGKELDFIAQEMNREINTLASKALATTSSKYVIKIKSEIEKIREQALNLE
jgi:uncharacterized protein (TIGR00255 family)